VTSDYSPIETVELVGGELCLDFTNTTSRRATSSPRERLRSYVDLVVWWERVGVVDGGEAAWLRAEADRRPEDAARVLESARALREAIYRVFSANARGEEPSAADLSELNAALRESQARRRLVRRADGFDWEWAEDLADSLRAPLAPVAYSAAELLTSSELDRVKECLGENCTWLFLDGSRNRSRRWCEMRDCGNRAKARRFYARRKGTEAS
jgi:predicted RNA-binding Zn ribbon-like protein